MRHVRLGSTGLKVSQLCLGTMTFGLQCDEPTSVAILDRAAAGGITFLDTSDVYPIGGNLGTVGRTEEIIGRWLEGRRHDFIVATKCFGAMSARVGPGAFAQAHPRRDRGFAAPSRHRLRRPLPAPPSRSVDADGREPAGARRHRARGQGALRRLLELLRVSDRPRARAQRAPRSGAIRLRAAPLQPALPPGRARALPAVRRGRSGRIPYNPIAGGLLSGKHRREAGPMPGTRFTHPTAGARYRDRYWRELETVEALRPLAAEAGMSMTQMAVAWVLENPVVTAPIVGASRIHLREDCRQLAKTAGEFEGGSPLNNKE